jgi:hypothetical protein
MKYLLITFLFLCACCGGKGHRVEVQNAADEFDVERLFEKDGCAVYRFHDGNHHYFVNCKGSTMSMIPCGKGCIREEKIDSSMKSGDK